MRVLLILALLLTVYLFLKKKVRGFAVDNTPPTRASYQRLKTSTNILKQTFTRTMSNVGMGIILLCIMLLLIAKLKILLFLLPISIFLIAYLFLFTNHVSKTREEQIWFNTLTNDVYVERLKKPDYHFNLEHDIQDVCKIESIQKTKGLLYGYYRIRIKKETLEIPYLIAENSPTNDVFFNRLAVKYNITLSKKMFPFL